VARSSASRPRCTGNGTLLVQIPLTAGAGSGAVADALPGATVRILDTDGAVVAESPLTGISR
jgi:hypothetical protein